MTSYSPVRDLSQKAYRDFHLDGILDILVGLSCISLGLWLELNVPAFAFLAWFTIILYKSLKNSITIPRFGYVSFDLDKTQLILFMAVALVTLLALLGARFFLFSSPRAELGLTVFLRKYHPFVMGSLGGLLLVFFGAWRGVRRFVAYGLILLASIGIGYWQGLSGQTPLFIAGGVMLAVGLVMLVLFIRQNPPLESEVENAS